MSEHVRRRKVVPRATLADLDDVNLELGIFSGHFVELRTLLHAPFVAAELIPVHVRDVSQPYLAADRASGVGGLSVELGRAQQIRVRVADVGHGCPAAEHGGERGAPRQPVVDNRSPHAAQITTDQRRGRVLVRQCRAFRLAGQLSARDSSGNPTARRETCASAGQHISFRRIASIHRRDIVRFGQAALRW